jgi:DNA-binding winged helix-turn-helix (wHTH) protein/TolB-like protein/Tfp pilus assembly protein PilF
MELNGSNFNGLREFDRFRLDTSTRVLWCGDKIVDLPPKAVDVLCVLVERQGEVVSKRELIDLVWAESFVEESNLTHQVYELRKAFKEHGCETDLIQTVSRRGYRFTGGLKESFDGDELVIEHRSISKTLIEELIDKEPDEKLIPMPVTTVAVPLAIHMPRKRRTGSAFAIALLCSFVLLAGGFAIWQWNRAKSRISLADVRSIAVLPMQSFNGDDGDDSLRMRLTDSLITKLGNIETISVRPTSSVARYSGSAIDPLELGRMLEVDAILDGRTQREGSKVRITLQLVSTKTGEQIWSDQFDGEADHLLDLQDAISARLLSRFDLRLSKEQETAFEKRPTANTEAFEEYLKGRFFWNRRTPESLRSAVSSYQNAINLDPNFAEAYAGLADSYYLLVDYSYDTSPANVALANENLNKTISLNPNLADAYVTKGLIQTAYEWKWKDAEDSFKKAVSLAPNSPNAHHRYAMLLLKLRRFDEAETQMLRAKQLDPTSPGINMNLGVVYYFSKRYSDAAKQFGQTLILDGSFSSPRWYLARCLWMSGSKTESIAEYVRATQSVANGEAAALLEKRSADPTLALKELRDLWTKQMSATGINAHDLAILSALIDDREATLKWLERSAEERHPWTSNINAEPEFDFVRDDPRFQAMLNKLGLS